MLQEARSLEFKQRNTGPAQLMPTAQQVRLRASCLRWRPREFSAQYTRFVSRSANRPPSFPPSKRNDESANKASPSLLEELFPEEAQKHSQASSRPKERDIPRLDVRSTLPKPPATKLEARPNTNKPTADNWWNKVAVSNKEAPAPPPAPADKSQQYVGGVLMLRNASKTLVEDDFTRLIPQGLHIEGWPLDQADIVKVIPGRNTSTLERDNFYFILFRSRASMNAYRTHVLQLHSLASRYVQSSLSSPIPPPPGYHINGQDVDALLQSYTLLPPSRVMHLLPLPNVVGPALSDIIKNRGYPSIVKGPLKEPYIVMLHLEGPQLPITVVKGAIGRVERERRIPWDRDFGTLSSHMWVPKAKNISPLDTRSRLDRLDSDKHDDNPEGQDVEKGDGEQKTRRDRRRPKAAYLFGFHDHDSALTFVQYWHRRSLVMPNFIYENDEIAPVVDAELLW